MARQQQRYSMSHHHQHPYRPYPPPCNPFQGKGRNILPRPPVAPREGALSRVFKQACVVLTIGTLLVSALSLAIPPAPTDVNSMAAPRPRGLRKGGGVRSQSRVRTSNKKPEDSRHANTSHHWDADTLESENQVLADDDDVSSDKSPAAKASKEELAAKIESKTKEENTVADGAFGSKQDEEKVKSASGDGNGVDADTDSAPKGSVKVLALDSQDKNRKEVEMKTDKQREKKDLKRHEDSNDEKDTENSQDKIIDATDDKREKDSRNKSLERKDAFNDVEGSKDGNVNQDSKADSKSLVVNDDGTVAKVSRTVDGEVQLVSKYDDKQQDKDLDSNSKDSGARSTSKEDASGGESLNKAEKESVQGKHKPLDSALERTKRVAREIQDESDDTRGDGAVQKVPAKLHHGELQAKAT